MAKKNVAPKTTRTNGTAGAKVSRPTKELAKDAATVGILCGQKAMGMIPVEARELIIASFKLGEFDKFCNPENNRAQDYEFQHYTDHDNLRREMQRAGCMLTGLDNDFFGQWRQETEELNKRIAVPYKEKAEPAGNGAK